MHTVQKISLKNNYVFPFPGPRWFKKGGRKLLFAANLAIDRDYYRKLEAAKLAKNPPGGRSGLTPEDQHKIRAAMDRAKADGRPIDKLSLKLIKDILKDKF